MTEYTKADYLAACEALYDGKPTEYLYTIPDTWRPWLGNDPPSRNRAHERQWRPVDPLREYKEAFAQGKRVEWIRGDGSWFDVKEYGLYIDGENPDNFRIVEPKTVKLYPFVVFDKDNVLVAYEYKTNIDIAKRLWPSYKVYPINPDGSIEVES